AGPGAAGPHRSGVAGPGGGRRRHARRGRGGGAAVTDGLLLDAALWRTATDGPPAPDRAAVERLAAEHVERRQAAGGDRIAALLGPARARAAVGRAVVALGVGAADVAVLRARGAGGWPALADRESAAPAGVAPRADLQALDDPAGKVARSGAAART